MSYSDQLHECVGVDLVALGVGIEGVADYGSATDWKLPLRLSASQRAHRMPALEQAPSS